MSDVAAAQVGDLRVEYAAAGRRDYFGKGWLQKNSSHIGTLWLCGFLGAVYFVLPLVGKPVPSIPAEAWIAIGGIIGVQKWKSGQADIEANKAPVVVAPPPPAAPPTVAP